MAIYLFDIYDFTKSLELLIHLHQQLEIYHIIFAGYFYFMKLQHIFQCFVFILWQNHHQIVLYLQVIGDH